MNTLRVTCKGRELEKVNSEPNRVSIIKSIILVNDQLEAQLFFRICLFQISTCFGHSCAHHQEN
jgi:hypothetical protein